MDELVKEYFEAKPSYRDLSRKYDIDKKRINSWVKNCSDNFKTTIDVAKELHPSWTGYLTTDGKIVKYRGRKGCMYIGVDNSGDIVHILAADGYENKTSWALFFKELKENIKYQLVVLISDGNPDIPASCLIYYQYFIYQTCAFHFLKRIDRSFGYLTVLKHSERRKQFTMEIELRRDIRRLLNQKTISEFMSGYNHILNLFEQKYYTGQYCFVMLELLKNNLGYLTPHYFDPQIPSTSNMAETTIKQYERRLKTIEGFQSKPGFKNYLTVFTMFLRFKEYTDCKGKNKHKNGQNRLQLSTVNTDKIGWFSWGKAKKSNTG
jgi:transposase-like protein